MAILGSASVGSGSWARYFSWLERPSSSLGTNTKQVAWTRVSSEKLDNRTSTAASDTLIYSGSLRSKRQLSNDTIFTFPPNLYPCYREMWQGCTAKEASWNSTSSSVFTLIYGTGHCTTRYIASHPDEQVKKEGIVNSLYGTKQHPSPFSPQKSLPDSDNIKGTIKMCHAKLIVTSGQSSHHNMRISGGDFLLKISDVVSLGRGLKTKKSGPTV